MYMLLGTSLAKAATDWGRKAPSATFCTINSPVSHHGGIPCFHMLPVTRPSPQHTGRLPGRPALSCPEKAVSAFVPGHRTATRHGDHVLARHQQLQVTPDSCTLWHTLPQSVHLSPCDACVHHQGTHRAQEDMQSPSWPETEQQLLLHCGVDIQ